MTFDPQRFLTIKGEVTKKSRQQVHDKHGQDGDVGHILHALLGGTMAKNRRKNTFIYHSSMCVEKELGFCERDYDVLTYFRSSV